ncbi:MAG: RNA polymerase sigma factor SigF [Candidatus Nanopelagicales bacterium]
MTVTPRRSRRWSERDRAREHEILAELDELPDDDPRHKALRDELVTMNLPLVEHLARRFRERGEAHEDLVQVGTVGLIKAVDRFDTSRGVEFSTYATPTIVGEIKRHFRDRGWAVRVPRRLQELRIALSRTSQELAQETGRSPTVAELAQRLEISEEEVLEGLESAQAYATASLDAGTGSGSDGDDTLSLGDTMGSEDDALEGVENRETLKPLLMELDERERRILMLRFFKNQTQSQIAEELGISQMHVSRILSRTLSQLRAGMLDEY